MSELVSCCIDFDVHPGLFTSKKGSRKYICMLPTASTSFTVCDVSKEVGGDVVIFSQADVVLSLQ